VQNVFEQQVVRPVTYELSPAVIQKLEEKHIPVEHLKELEGQRFHNMSKFREALISHEQLSESQLYQIFNIAQRDSFRIDSTIAEREMDPNHFTPEQIEAVKKLHGKVFVHKWQLDEALAQISPAWRLKPDKNVNKIYNKAIRKKRRELYLIFRVSQ
jgi:PiT family inorganic phosphate transporter